VTVLIVGAATFDRAEEAVTAFEAEGFRRIRTLDQARDGDVVLGVSGFGAELLRQADELGIKYVLVHDGPDDGQGGGTYERAHHRIEAPQRAEVAQHLRSRERPVVTCLAFAYKNGVPADAAILIDARFLDNPYWVPELKELTGHDPEVRRYVMKQPSAARLVEDIHRMVRDLMPLYLEKGRMHLVVAFGCTGGRHRSVVLASELAQQLRKISGIDVDFVTRDLD
jgi:hypothetical protein